MTNLELSGKMSSTSSLSWQDFMMLNSFSEWLLTKAGFFLVIPELELFSCKLMDLSHIRPPGVTLLFLPRQPAAWGGSGLLNPGFSSTKLFLDTGESESRQVGDGALNMERARRNIGRAVDVLGIPSDRDDWGKD